MKEEEEVGDPTRPLCTEPSLIMLTYAGGGVGKSTLMAQATRYWHKRGLRSRVIGTDNGSYDPYERGIKEGYIDYLSADAWDKISPTVLYKLLAEGWWPEDPKTPNSPLKPGYLELRLCPKCGGDSGSRGAAQTAKCASCGEAFPAGTRLPISRKLTSLAGIGCVIFEGITKIGDILLSACRESRPGDRFYVAASFEGQALAQRANDALKKESPSVEDSAILKEAREACERHELSLAKGASMDHYLKAQSDVGTIIAACKKLPIPHVLWTALEGWEEELLDKKNPNGPKKLLGLGPALPGKGLTRKCIPWFSSVAHVQKVAKKDSAGKPVGGEERVMFLDPHFGIESSSIPWQAKCNVVGIRPKVVLPDPNKENGFGLFMGAVEEAKGRDLP